MEYIRHRALAVLIAVLLCVAGLRAQTGNTVTIIFPGAPTGTCSFVMYAIDSSTGNFYDCPAGTWHNVGGGGGGGTPGGSVSNVQYNLDGTNFAGISNGTAGQALISNGPGTPATFQDPIVSGPAAEGATPVGNPVWVSGKGADGFIHAIRMANDGTVRVDPTGTTTQPVSGTVAVSNFPATQPVSGTVTANQGTSPWVVSGTVTANAGTGTLAVSSTQLPAALDGSGFLKVHEQGTATVSGTVTANAGTGNFTVVQATGSNLHVAVDSMPTTTVTGTVAATQSGTWTLQPGNTANTTAWLVTGTGGTFPSTQSGTWTVQPGNTANTTPWLVTANAGTGNFAENLAQYGGNNVVSNAVNGLIPTGNYGTQNTALASWTSATTVNTAAVAVNNITGYSNILLTVNQGTTITGGVLTFEESNDNSNWFSVQGVNLSTVLTVGPTYTLVASTYSPFIFQLSAPYFRVRLSTAISGSATVTIGYALNSLVQFATMAGSLAQGTSPWVNNTTQLGGTAIDTNSGNKSAGTQRVVLATDQPNLTTPLNVALAANQSVNLAQVNGATTVTVATGVLKVGVVGNAGATLDSAIGAATAPTDALATSGVFQTTTPAPTAGQAVAMQIDSAGSHLVSTEGRKNSYRAAKSFTCVAGDIAVMPGSATKTIKLTGVEVTLSTSGAVAFSDVQLIKRSAADTAGTSAAMTSVPLDSNDAAASAAPLNYTVAPTLGTAVGPITSTRILDEGTGSNQATQIVFQFGGNSGIQPVVLRGTAQQIGVNFSAIVATGTCSVAFSWTEE